MSSEKLKININLIHKKLTQYLKIKLKIYRSKKFSPDYDTPIYYSSFYNNIGLLSIKKYLGIKTQLLTNFFYLIKDFFYILKYANIKTFTECEKIIASKVILTWGGSSNFKDNGSFNDNYLNINSNKDKNIFWVILFNGKNFPKKIGKNLLLIHVNRVRNYNFLILIKVILSKLRFAFKDFQYFLFSISCHNFLSEKIYSILSNKITSKIKSFLVVYEAQPFQNKLIQYFKMNRINTIGYIHFPPLALPLHLIKKKYSPDKIILNGKDQKKCFLKLGWNKREIFVLPSTRFLKKNVNFSNKLFLPISIKSPNNILKNLDILATKYNFDLKSLTIQNHPHAINSKIHIKLISNIEMLKNNYKKLKILKQNNKNLSVFVGASGAIIEALERGNNVIQVTEETKLDLYSNYLWPSLKIKKISDNIYSYQLLKKQNLIKLGSQPKNLNIYFNSNKYIKS